MNDGRILYKADKREWIIEAKPDVKLRLKRIFAGMGYTSTMLKLSDTLDVARDLEWVLQRYDLGISNENRARISELAAAHRARALLVEKYLHADHNPEPIDLAIPARRYQLAAAELADKFFGVLCADDLGIGKTVVAISLISMQGKRPALVGAPPALTAQWKRQLEKFAPKLSVHVVDKRKPYDIGIATREGLLKIPDVVIIGYSNLAYWKLELLKMHFKTMVLDEIQEFRNDDTRRYEAAALLRDQVTWRLGLSATPINNLGHEFFPVMSLLRPDELGEKSEWRREWCNGADSRDRAALADPEAFGAYLRKSGMMVRRTRKDVGMELPPVTRVFHEVPYDESAMDAIATPAAELARIILEKNGPLLRGEQMRARGEFDLMVRQATGIAKAPAVADFVKLILESEEKVLLYGWHRSVYEIWLERLKEFSPLLFTGSESPAEKEKHREMFVSGDSRLLIMSLRAGVGLDGLQAVCRTVVTGEFDWSPAVHDQNETRIDRPGQEHPVFVYYCHTLGGSDPDIVSLLQEKKRQSAGVMGTEAELFKTVDRGDHLLTLAKRYLEKSRRVA
jgi:SNF2 family DNA or RNA helicase